MKETNIPRKSTGIQPKDPIDEHALKKYCFEIYHDEELNLSSYYLVININSNIVYSSAYSSKVVFSFVKKTTLNTLAILLYDKENSTVFSWSNKDVFDFEEYPDRCYKIKLLSEENMDHSNGVEMKVK